MINIVVIQLARLGDIIQTIPLLDDIIEVYPEANIHLFVNELFQECHFFLKDIRVVPVVLENLADKNENLSSKQSVENYLIQLSAIFSSKISLLINLNNSVISKYITDFLDCDTKLGFGTKDSLEWSAFVTSFLPTRHLGSLNLVDIFKGFFYQNIKNKNHSLMIKTKDSLWKSVISTTKKQIALQCGARNIKRQFTFQHYIDIAKHYLQRDYQVFLLGIKSESKTANAIFNKIKHKNLIDTTGKTDLKMLLEIVSSCEMVYTPDTGTMHLATFCGTPFTSLFCGPAYPFETLAYNPAVTVFMPDREVFPCYPCKDDEVCPYDFACHSFSFSKFFTGEGNKGFKQLSVDFDKIGQVLTPIDEMAVLWREFTKFYFFESSTLPHNLPILYIEGNSLLLKRELRLWDIVDINDLEVAKSNFHFLKPLIYFNKLSKDKRLIQSALNYFNSILSK